MTNIFANLPDVTFNLAGLDCNDIVNGCDNGLVISVWFQGCPHHCKGCHNAETWNQDDGIIYKYPEIWNLLNQNLDSNDIKRNLSILGGEPLSEWNRIATIVLITKFHEQYPDRKIFLWTGYTIEEIEKMPEFVLKGLKNVTLLITDRFEIEKRDINLKYRGSSNQRIWTPKNFLWIKYLKNITHTL